MKKIFTKLFLTVLAFLFLCIPFVQAQTNVPTPMDRLKNTANSANLSTVNVSPQNIVVSVILVLFGLLGIVFLVLIIYAGFTWMTSQGEKDKIAKAKATIVNSVIGITIIILSYSIITFINKLIIDSTTNRFLE